MAEGIRFYAVSHRNVRPPRASRPTKNTIHVSRGKVYLGVAVNAMTGMQDRDLLVLRYLGEGKVRIAKAEGDTRGAVIAQRAGHSGGLWLPFRAFLRAFGYDPAIDAECEYQIDEEGILLQLPLDKSSKGSEEDAKTPHG